MNQLKVNHQQNIIALHERGWSKRKISRGLGLDRGTVRKYLEGVDSKPPTPQTGSEPPPGAVSPDKTLLIAPTTNSVTVSLESSTNLVEWSQSASVTLTNVPGARFFRMKLAQ